MEKARDNPSMDTEESQGQEGVILEAHRQTNPLCYISHLKRRAPCQREVKKRLPVKVHRWRNQGHWFQRRRNPSIWCYAARGARGKILRRIRDIRSTRWMSMKDRVVKLAQGNLCRPKPRIRIFSSEKTGKSSKFKSLETGQQKRYLRTLLVQKRLYGHRLQEQSFKTWSARTINTWRRSSISCNRSWELQQDTQHFRWKRQRQMCWYGECLRQWKQPFILDRIIWRIWRSTRTRTSRKFGAYSISHRNWYWSILKKFWMWLWLKVHLPHGRDQYCLMIKWYSRQRQK